ncbi:MAG TPA: hypothetical protein VHX43_10685 [Xanthobacteraceae bacterium]|jgi:hypothetical protein|nr:hypothetical protein [Xanthobacteraceae bacterium]
MVAISAFTRVFDALWAGLEGCCSARAFKRCKRARTCIGDKPMECWERVKDRRRTSKAKRISGRITIFEWARLERLWRGW